MSKAGKISVFHVLHHLYIGGMENGVVNLINNLPDDRFEHTVVCVEDFSDFRQRIVNPQVQVLAMHRSRIGTWPLRRQLYQLFASRRPSIVHSRNMSGLDALLPARLAGVPTLHSEHGFDVDNLDGKARKPIWLRRLHAPLVKRYVTVSRNLQDLLVKDVGIAPSRIRQIYNGVDTDRFKPAAQRPLDLLPAGFAGPDAFIIGTVGRAQAIKDQATLIQAFAALRATRLDQADRLRLLIVGDGPKLASLRELAASLGVGDQVWLPGARQDVARLLQTCHLFVLPSLNEGISNTLLEAMSTGLPALATAVGGNVELVDDGVVGHTFTPGDVNGLAGLMGSYLAQAGKARAQGQAAREYVLQKFSLKSMVAAYADTYQQLEDSHVRHHRSH